MQRWNLNRLFGRLDIRSKLAIAFVGLSGLPLALVGWYAAEQHLQSLADAATQEQRRSLVAVRDRVEGFLNGVGADLDFLSGFHPVRSLSSGGAVSPSTLVPGTREMDRNAVEEAFRDFLRAKPDYYRLRLLAANGVELAHAVRSAGLVRVMQPGRWRGTGFLYYSNLLTDLGKGDSAFAPVELLPMQDPATLVAVAGAERPASPTSGLISALSFVRRVDSGGALLVADVLASPVFELLREAEPRPGESVILVGPAGEYLFHSVREEEWNTLLANRHANNLLEDLPETVVRRVTSGESGVILDDLDAVAAYTPLFGGGHGSPKGFTLVSIIPKAMVFAPVQEVRRFIMTAGVATLMVAALLALVAAHQFAAPIRELTKGAARLARGKFDAPLEIETNDEIEDLARTFTAMAEALATREGQILRQRGQLTALLDNMGEGVAVSGADHEVRFLNRFLLERFGEPAGRTSFELFLGREGTCEDCPPPGTAPSSSACGCRQGRALDGRYYEVLAFPLEDFDGEPAVLEIHRDITARREMERELHRYTGHLETMVEERTRELERSHARLIQQEKMIAVGQLAAGVAHELGTPLATILCHAQMAQEDLGTPVDPVNSRVARAPSDADASLKVVVSQVNRCSEIVRNLLDFSRPSTKERTELSVNDLADRVTRLMQHDLERRGLEIRLEKAASDPCVIGNENELEQVLVNLIRNAADAMLGHGEIAIRIDLDDSNPKACSGLDGRRVVGPSVKISVRDTGFGIPENEQAHIFDPFYTTKAPGVGTGLGLWIVYNAVAEHGGDLEVQSAPGRGTEISFELPLAEKAK